MEWHAFDHSDSWAQALAGKISATLQQSVDVSGWAHLAVSGGKSPIPFFNLLSKAAIDWGRVRISLVDERFIAPSNADSNEHLARTHLLVNRAAQAQFQGLVCDPGDLRKSIARANENTEEITLAILGMGEDGHTASLFPGAPQLPEALDAGREQRYIAITPVDAPYERISMTLRALLQAQGLILAISGKHKQEVFQRAAHAATPTLPISYLIAQNGVPLDVYWFA